METTAVPAHQWTNGGTEVLILKCVAKDGASYNGFKWPLTVGAVVEAPDWSPEAVCGGGLHGWPWGLAMGDGKDPDWGSAWLVFGADPSGVVNLGGKCKCRRVTIRFVGEWQAATNFVLSGQIAWVQQAARGAASATGWRGAASATGARGAASATGESGAASATGWSGAASATGASGAASATGESGAASAGEKSIAAVTGGSGRAKAGAYSAIALSWWNESAERAEMRCREVGYGDGSDGKLKADQWYRMDEAGEFIEDNA